MIRPCLERKFFLPTQGRNPERAARASQSVSFVAPPRAHYTTVSTDLSTRSTHVLSTRSLGRLSFATRSVSPSTQGDPRCSLPYTTGRDCFRQSGGGYGERGWGWGCVNRRHTSAFVVLPLPVYGPCLGSASFKFNLVRRPLRAPCFAALVRGWAGRSFSF